ERVLEFVFLNRHTFLPSRFQLIEDALRLIDFLRLALQFHPAPAGCHFYPERIFESFQELEIVGVERLQIARVLKLQGARFRHELSVASASCRRSEPDWH